jgi:hypothetical protein
MHLLDQGRQVNWRDHIVADLGGNDARRHLDQVRLIFHMASPVDKSLLLMRLIPGSVEGCIQTLPTVGNTNISRDRP